MTPKRYFRLFLVSVLPLLLFGFVFAAFVYPYPRHHYVECRPGFERSYCHWGTDDYERFEARKNSEANDNVGWFHIFEGAGTGYLEDTIEAKTIALDVQIVEASSEPLNALVGKAAQMALGIPTGKHSIITNNAAFLWCDRLQYLLEDNRYDSYCYGDGWDGYVKFTVSLNGRDYQLLQGLWSEIESVRADRRLDFAVYCLIVLPMFVYLFFVVSGIIWLGVKAVKFVRNG